jgi:hypothetical protein
MPTFHCWDKTEESASKVEQDNGDDGAAAESYAEEQWHATKGDFDEIRVHVRDEAGVVRVFDVYVDEVRVDLRAMEVSAREVERDRKRVEHCAKIAQMKVETEQARFDADLGAHLADSSIEPPQAGGGYIRRLRMLLADAEHGRNSLHGLDEAALRWAISRLDASGASPLADAVPRLEGAAAAQNQTAARERLRKQLEDDGSLETERDATKSRMA